MRFENPLLRAKLVKRYKRFLADAILDNGELVTAHCPNTGSMKSCGSPGDTIFLSYRDSPKRKLKYTWELTATAGGYIGVNTARPNEIVATAIKNGAIAELKGYESLRREVKYGQNSRIDILLESINCPRCWVEVKNVTLLTGDSLAFPDAVSARGTKHLWELTAMVESGERAVLFFLINRPGGSSFRPAREIDPLYAAELLIAQAAGVEVLAYRAVTGLDGVVLGETLPIVL